MRVDAIQTAVAVASLAASGLVPQAPVAPPAPRTPAEMLRPMALYLMGVLNWSDRWFRPDGPIRAEQMAAQVNKAFLHGWLSFGSMAAR